MQSLKDSLSEISVELIPIHERLVTVRRQLVSLAAKEGSHKAELKPLAEELRKIDSLSTPFIAFASQTDQLNLQETRRWQIPRTRGHSTCITGSMLVAP